MPTLPIIIERQPVGALELPRQGVSAGERAFKALGAFGEALAEAQEKRRRVDLAVQASERDAELGKTFDNIEIEASRKSSSTEILPFWNESVESLRQSAFEGIEDPELKAHMQAVLNRHEKNSFGRVRQLENKRWLDEGRATFFSSYNESLRQLGKMVPGSPEYQLEKHKIDSRIETLDAEGFFSDQEIVKIREDQAHQIDQQRGFFLLETNPQRLKDSLTPENFPDLSGQERNTLKNHAEASISAARIEANRQEAEARNQENVEFWNRLQRNQLSLGNVIESQLLSREDREFFKNALQKTEPVRTDPATAITIENLLSAPTATQEEEIANATKAKALIERAYLQSNQLKKEDALRMLKEANKVLRGEDPEGDRWLKITRAFLKDKFGFDSNIQRFLNPQGADTYWQLMSQLMQEQEDGGLQGRALFDRAKQLAAPYAVNFWSDQAGRQTPAMNQLPDPAQHKGKTIVDTETGKKLKSDGSRWVPEG